MICLSSGGSLALLEIIIHNWIAGCDQHSFTSSKVRPKTYWMLSTFSLIICTVSAELSKTIYHFKRLRLWRPRLSLSDCTCFRTPSSIDRTDTQEGVLAGVPASATCVQRFDDSLNSAIRITYRISLRSSSMREPRYPLLRVVLLLK